MYCLIAVLLITYTHFMLLILINRSNVKYRSNNNVIKNFIVYKVTMSIISHNNNYGIISMA